MVCVHVVVGALEPSPPPWPPPTSTSVYKPLSLLHDKNGYLIKSHWPGEEQSAQFAINSILTDKDTKSVRHRSYTNIMLATSRDV